MNWIERAVGGICRAVLWVSTSVIFVILCANTVLRYATGSSLQWGNEVPELLFPWLVMAGVVLAALQGAHITTSFMMEKLPLRDTPTADGAVVDRRRGALRGALGRRRSGCSRSCTTRSRRSCRCPAR